MHEGGYLCHERRGWIKSCSSDFCVVEYVKQLREGSDELADFKSIMNRLGQRAALQF